MDNSLVFALDVGTRKIAGMIMERTDDGFFIRHALMQEQYPGAMRDGQIHDIPKVAKAIKSVTLQLGEESGLALKKAAVAAAGRSLLTRVGESTYRFSSNTRLSSAMVKTLELRAVQHALMSLPQAGDEGLEQYLCTGYSVVGTYLDRKPISSLIGQHANTAEVKVIATFLPRLVLSSLAGALEMVGLEMASLTLEPIAAIHTVVPASMRMLNIALVDIGAGTSDIAISHQGSIHAYGMVPVAGDEITEGIAQEYLLDFTVAENLKRHLHEPGPMECKDVLGNPLKLTGDEIGHVIYPLVQDLVAQIAEEIIRLNGGVPKGVILIGGGSLTPGLQEALAEKMSIPSRLVRISGRGSLSTVQGVPAFDGPQVVTPISIGCAHLDGINMSLQKATVNSQVVQFLEMPDLTVGHVLVYAGVPFNDIESDSVEVTLNGEVKIFKGVAAKQILLCNDKAATLDTPVEADAVIEVKSQTEAKSPLRLSNLVDVSKITKHLVINNHSVVLSPKVTVNGEFQTFSYRLQQGDDILIKSYQTIGDALAFLGTKVLDKIKIMLNGTPLTIPLPTLLRVNDEEGSLDMAIKDGMKIDYHAQYPSVKDVVSEIANVRTITLLINDEPVTLEPRLPQVNGTAVSWDHRLADKDKIETNVSAKDQYILSDIFRVISMESRMNRPNLKILLNGEQASFIAPVRDGDKISIV